MSAVLSDDAESPIVPGRACGTCTLCCKVLSITEIQKPQGKWCDHCAVGVGCKIYERRPTECRAFHCGFLVNGELSEVWRPSKCKFVMVAELDGNRLAIHVDPSYPSAWRNEPFYSQIKVWATAAAQVQNQVVVCIRNRAIVILPDRDVDLGPIAADELIVTKERTTPFGVHLDAFKIHKNDPLAAKVKGPVSPRPGR